MSITYEKSRVNFDIILDQYHKYLKLYEFFNGGDNTHATTFDKFYWVMSYQSKYRAGEEDMDRGY